ncbi:MAG: flagellar assembly protein FliW [Chloroflexi bacterium]|nr:flagellar assembly protein FliW [Chloroflexota bacterium]
MSTETVLDTLVVSPPAGLIMFTIAEGMIGCPTWQHFTLDAAPDMAPIGVLRCLDEPAISFYVVHPRYVVPDYQIVLGEGDRQLLGLAPGDRPELLCVLVVHADPFSISANLLGPIAWNATTGRARQLVLANSGYSAQHAIRGASAAGAAC